MTKMIQEIILTHHDHFRISIKSSNECVVCYFAYLNRIPYASIFYEMDEIACSPARLLACSSALLLLSENASTTPDFSSPPVWDVSEDTDQDGLRDVDELLMFDMDPLDPSDGLSDDDGDLLSLAWEIFYETDPDLADTDGDTWSDSEELMLHGTDPLDPKSFPQGISKNSQETTASSTPTTTFAAQPTAALVATPPPPSLTNGDFNDLVVTDFRHHTGADYQGKVFDWGAGAGNDNGWTAYFGSKIEVWKSGDERFIELDGWKDHYGVKQPIANVTPGSYILTWQQSGRTNAQAGDNTYKVQVYYLKNDTEVIIANTEDITPIDKTQWTPNALGFHITTEQIADANGSPIYVAFIPINLNTYGTLIDKVALVTVEIVPDYNRDGMIDQMDRGKVTRNDPWRWWINDDKDNSDYSADEESDVSGQADGNFSDESINGVTDLTDFFPIFLDIKKVLEVLPPGEYDYKLRHEEGALNFAEAPDLIPDDDPDYDGAGAFWRSAFWAENYKNLPVQQITPSGVSLSNSFLDQLKKGHGILLMEYRKASEAPLELEIWKGSQKFTTITFHSKAGKVEEMYRHLNLYEATGTQSSQLNDTGEPDNYPDDKTNDKAFVMIHGYASRGNGAKNDNLQRGFQSEIFRRLHQAGSKAKYVAAYWDSATGMDYHKSVYHAFKTSPILGPRLGFLAGNQITVAAHSLGNIVASNAISHEGFRPENYFLINAASPIESYDPSQVFAADGKVMKTSMTEKEWKPYDERFHSPNWHACFPVNDNRRKLKWKGRFLSIADHTKPFNFYSTGEDVVANPIHDDASLWRMVWDGFVKNQGIGRHSWVSQEFIKGGTSLAAGIAFEKNHGGWQHIGPFGNSPGHKGMGKRDPLNLPGIYSLYDADQSNQMLANGQYTNEHLAQFGLFKRFESPTYDALYAPIDDDNKSWPDYGGFPWENPHTQAQGSALAGQKDTQWLILASAMPSVSFAAAANAVDNIEGFDMNENKNGWPDLPSRESKYRQDWQHSDFASPGVAATFTKKMYEKMVTKGELNED